MVALFDEVEDFVDPAFDHGRHGIDLIVKAAFGYDLRGLCHIRTYGHALADRYYAEFS
jgi:hypothetical protein